MRNSYANKVGRMLKFKGGKSKRDKAAPARPVASAAPVHPRAADLTVGDYANGVPNIKLGAMFGSLMRQLLWVIPLFLMGCVAAWMLTADFKRTYTGQGTIMVQLGDEYVYQPIAGTQNQSSLMQTPDTITLNEVAILQSNEVLSQVIEKISDGPGGLAAFDRRLAQQLARYPEGSGGYQLAYIQLRKKMDQSFSVGARPRSSIIDMSFKHENPEFAVDTLNLLIDTYMSYRRSIFVEGAGEVITERRKDTEAQLRANERRMASFLSKNGISDFTSEQVGASTRTEDLRATLNTLQAQIVETERSLASVEDQLRQTPAEINLYVDDRASNRIAQAELELKQLLAKYLPNSDPVRQKQLEIEQLKSLQQRSGGQATGGRRVGPNPVHQDLMRSRNTLSAAADSLREREVVVQRQLNESDSKLRRMTALAPTFNDILRERETLNNRLKTYLNKEQEALITQQQAETSAENVKIISKATYPMRGRNMRMLAFVGASAAWGFTLLMLALFRVFIDPRLYVAPNTMTGTSAAYVPAAEPGAMAGRSSQQSQYAHHSPQNMPSHQPQEYVPPADHAYADPYASGYNQYNSQTPAQPYQPVMDSGAPYHGSGAGYAPIQPVANHAAGYAPQPVSDPYGEATQNPYQNAPYRQAS